MAGAFSELDDQALAWLVKLNSGQVSTADELAFFDWLHTSTAHQAAYLRAEALWQQADVVETLTSPRTPRTTATREILSHTGRQAKNQSFGKWAIACCAVLVIVAVGLTAIQPSAKHYHLVSAIGEQRQITLEDGTKVLLNTNSQLEVEYTPSHRLAKLIKGEVFFDVHPNHQRPFDVLTEFGTVRVVGTHFAVRQQPTDALVTVLEGRVALGKTAAFDEEFTTLIELNQNQQLSLQQARNGANPQSMNAKTALAWRDKQLVYQKQKLSLVIEDLNRYFSAKITLSDPTLGERDITAVIQLGELESTLAALCQPLNLQARFTVNRREVTLAAQP